MTVVKLQKVAEPALGADVYKYIGGKSMFMPPTQAHGRYGRRVGARSQSVNTGGFPHLSLYARRLSEQLGQLGVKTTFKAGQLDTVWIILPATADNQERDRLLMAVASTIETIS